MLKFFILLITLQTISTSPIPSWAALKTECQENLAAYNIYLGDLTEATFNTNVDAIEELNNGVDWEAGVNCFALLTTAQKGNYLQMTPPDVSGQEISVGATDVLEAAGDEMPDQYNHLAQKQMTDARNQGGCGSCWAFSAMSQLENAYIVKTGEWYTNVDFAEQQFLDCTYEHDPYNGGSSWWYDGYDGCQGGWMSHAWDVTYEHHNNKLASEKDYKYESQDVDCRADWANKTNAFAKTSFEPMTTSSDQVFRWYSDKAVTKKTGADGVEYEVVAESTARFIWKNYAVSVALQADDAFMSYRGGIFNTHTNQDESVINHAVTLFAYTQEYFTLQNSWGNWGIKGNMMITRRSGNIINMMTYMMYPKVVCTLGENDAGYCKQSATDDGCMCYNGGLCKDDGSCYCKFGWKGDYCKMKDEGDCGCQNDGACMSNGECKCKEGWIGDKCGKEDTCECVNGQCLESGECDCKTGWTGAKCDEEDEDGNCNCKNGGTCNIKGGCDCKEGFSGKFCDNKDDDCDCLNGGTCTSAGTCDCKQGFNGDKCENKDDDKDADCTKKCKRGKECFWKKKSEDEMIMSCRCPLGSWGKKCSQQADCTIEDKKVCAKLERKNPDKFDIKCSKNWGVKKCPHSCGHCRK